MGQDTVENNTSKLQVGGAEEWHHRRSYRVPVRGCACVHWRSGRLQRYSLENLSLGGARMLGAAVPEVGERVWAELQVSHAQPVVVSGRVVRVARAGDDMPGFAIAFANPSPEVEDLIHDLSLQLLQEGAPDEVLVVARSALMREQLACLLSNAGWRVVCAATPLEALDELDSSSRDVRWVVALDRLTQTSGFDLLSYVADNYPWVHRLLVARPTAHRQARDALQHGVADAALLQPIRKSRLDKTIGRCPNLTSR